MTSLVDTNFYRKTQRLVVTIHSLLVWLSQLRSPIFVFIAVFPLSRLCAPMR